ncbi:cytochrome c3 family protein [Ferrimonas balearica]|uniref:cytochrome c3 family protein n=1 Tax=Ferrimonas balearica TaxID=44012 RepID=UPI001C99708E|nr:cytochrome c3 family protein [Ferrimonas balearica]MBY5993581.1 cytochrome c3 family protein [Ferrimonas balearica]
MKKFLMTLALCLPLSAWAAPIADTHTDMAGCDACHDQGVPSEDLAYENETCIQCHGDLAALGGMHADHAGIMECTDCHITHEEHDANSGCANCH